MAATLLANVLQKGKQKCYSYSKLLFSRVKMVKPELQLEPEKSSIFSKADVWCSQDRDSSIKGDKPWEPDLKSS